MSALGAGWNSVKAVEMSFRFLRPEGPLTIRSLGADQHRAHITLPRGADGRLARTCPNQACSPGYFKVKPGTGITGQQAVAFCPYCRREAEPDGFSTQEQLRYAKDLVTREVHRGVDQMIRDSFKLGPSGRRKLGGGFVTMEVTLKSAPLPHVRPPFEDEVRRDVICPHCTLDQTVFGLATWCADCGADIFPTHTAAELDVVRRMLGDIARRREVLGRRVAAKDLENCIEDVVSIFEAAMKAMSTRYLVAAGASAEEAESQLRRYGNAFQNTARTQEVLSELLGVGALPEVPWESLSAAFAKRHPITHNLGVVDRKYLERAQDRQRPGREVRLVESEVEAALGHVSAALATVHSRLFGTVVAAA
ncbi:MAG: hypothetical protein KIT17_00915 [Rubrivivax sp.]|nr:hypothetical protein [Rubrivivax sp.]